MGGAQVDRCGDWAGVGRARCVWDEGKGKGASWTTLACRSGTARCRRGTSHVRFAIRHTPSAAHSLDRVLYTDAKNGVGYVCFAYPGHPPAPPCFAVTDETLYHSARTCITPPRATRPRRVHLSRFACSRRSRPVTGCTVYLYAREGAAADCHPEGYVVPLPDDRSMLAAVSTARLDAQKTSVDSLRTALQIVHT